MVVWGVRGIAYSERKQVRGNQGDGNEGERIGKGKE